MIEYRFILEPYKGMKTRFTCPECGKPKKFARYIDKETNEYLGDKVGRCERSDNCGWHYTPKQYFEDTGHSFEIPRKEINTRKVERVKPISYIDATIMQQSLAGYQHNNFISYLNSLFDTSAVRLLTERYKIGTSKKWPGATVFWQVDTNGKVRSGKVMQYSAETGKRVKVPFDMITWVHTILKKDDFNLSQCFFGEHLLKSTDKPLAIVESEKTAIIASAYLPQLTWLACGNKNGLSDAKCKLLNGRGVILYPDLNAYEEWNKKAKQYGFRISDLLERKSTEQERSTGLDLADYLIRFSVSDFKLPGSTNIPEQKTAPYTEDFSLKDNVKNTDSLSSPNIDPEVIKLHASYKAAEESGRLSAHPELSFISALWQGLTINRSRPAQRQYYIEQLKQIAI